MSCSVWFSPHKSNNKIDTSHQTTTQENHMLHQTSNPGKVLKGSKMDRQHKHRILQYKCCAINPKIGLFNSEDMITIRYLFPGLYHNSIRNIVCDISGRWTSQYEPWLGIESMHPANSIRWFFCVTSFLCSPVLDMSCGLTHLYIYLNWMCFFLIRIP